MACTSLVPAWWSRSPNEYGNYYMVFNPRQALNPDDVQGVPCGRCFGCKLERSRQGMIRSTHESSMFSQNCFITLTYAPENLPLCGGISVLCDKHLSDFWKRFRKKFAGVDEIEDLKTGEWIRPIRYYACGEYGENFGRPHYHASVFNFDFKDLVQFGWSKGFRNAKKFPLYTSPTLEKLWGHGFVNVAPFNPSTAGYVARYVLKKQNGKVAEEEHYSVVNPDTGEVVLRPMEFARQSNRPGIGAYWYHKFKSDIYPNDHFVFDGKVMRPPRYYDDLFEKDDPAAFRVMKDLRASKRPVIDNEFLRDMEAKHVIVEQHVQQLVRSLV